jgi:polysaccharide biosynthesis transport protein
MPTEVDRPEDGRTISALNDLKLGAYLEIASRRRWWLILSTIGCVVAAVVVAYRLPNLYKAETVILVNSAEVPDKYVPTLVTADIAARLATLQQQVLSPTRLKKMVETERAYLDPGNLRTEEEVVRSLQKSIVVEVVNPGGKMGAFRIAYTGKKREGVARIANELAQMFIQTNLQSREDQTKETADFLESQLQDTKRQLDEKDAQLRAIKSQNILDLPESKPYHMEALANLRTQLQTIQDKIAQDLREKSVLESMLASGGGAAPTVDTDSGGEGAPQSPYQAQIQKLEARLSELRGRYGPGHPDVRRVRDELNKLKAKAAEEPQSNATPTVDQKPALQTAETQKRRNPVLEAQIENLDEEIKQQTKLLGPLQERMEFHTTKLQQEPVFEQQIARLQQDYEILKTQYTQLLEKEKAAEISHALEVRQKGEHFEILDAAVTPDKPAAPNRLLIGIGGLFLGVFAGCCLVALRETNDESVRTEAEAALILGRAVLVGVPKMISTQERNRRRWVATGLVIGTVAGAVIVGLGLSVVAGGLF